MTAKPDPKQKDRRVAGRPRARKAGAPEVEDEIDRLIHEPLRLRIMSALAVVPSMSFNELKETLGASDGNLSVHARKLEDAGYVSCDKAFSGRLPKTTFALTNAGRRALEDYLGRMEAIIRAARKI